MPRLMGRGKRTVDSVSTREFFRKNAVHVDRGRRKRVLLNAIALLLIIIVLLILRDLQEPWNCQV